MENDYRNNTANPESAAQLLGQLNREKKLRAARRRNFTAGLVIVLLAAVGVAFLLSSGIKYISARGEQKKQELYSSYDSLLLPLAAIDPPQFDDITAAPMEELIEISVWSIISAGLNPDEYDYSSGELGIPAQKVEQAFTGFFGTQLSIVHQSAEGYGYKFEYDAQDNVYYIPLTTIAPVYTPHTVSVESRGGVTSVRCGLINAEAWAQDSSTGDMVQPEPDKYITVTFREFSGARYISSVQVSGRPETAAGAAVSNAAVTAVAATGEDTTAAETTAAETTAAE